MSDSAEKSVAMSVGQANVPADGPPYGAMDYARDPCTVHPCKVRIARVKHPRAGGLDPRGSHFWKPPEAGPPELLFEIELYEPRQTRPNRLS